MVKEYYKKSFPPARKYRSPKIYGTTRRQEKRKIKISPALIKSAILVIIVLLIIYYFFFSPAFRIKDIIVEGNSLVKKEDIISALPQNANIFRFNIDGSRQLLLAKFPEIKAVEIYRGIPDALKIIVLERDNKMVWQTNGEYYFVSADGFVSRKISATEAGALPVIVDIQNLPLTPGTQLVSPNFVAFVTNVYSSFQSEEGIKPLNFEIPETTFNINLKTDAGFYIKLNSLRSSEKQLSDLKAILAQYKPNIHEYVDLRIDGWAYYK